MAIHPSQIINGVPKGGAANQVLTKDSATDYAASWKTLAAPTWASVTGKPATFPPATHTHAAGDITSGTFAIARIPNGTPTGGTTGQLLAKKSGTAHDVEWVTKVDGLPANGAWTTIPSGTDDYEVRYRKVANGFVEAVIAFTSKLGDGLAVKPVVLPAGFRPHTEVDTVSSSTWHNTPDGVVLVEGFIFDDGSVAAGTSATTFEPKLTLSSPVILYFLYAIA